MDYISGIQNPCVRFLIKRECIKTIGNYTSTSISEQYYGKITDMILELMTISDKDIYAHLINACSTCCYLLHVNE